MSLVLNHPHRLHKPLPVPGVGQVRDHDAHLLARGRMDKVAVHPIGPGDDPHMADHVAGRAQKQQQVAELRGTSILKWLKTKYTNPEQSKPSRLQPAATYGVPASSCAKSTMLSRMEDETGFSMSGGCATSGFSRFPVHEDSARRSRTKKGLWMVIPKYRSF